MPAPRPRPDFEARARALRLPVAAVISELRAILGARLVAYIARVSDTATVRAWACGNGAPDRLVESRLRAALQIALTVSATDGAATTQAWFQGRAPELDDVSPARMLRDGEPSEAVPLVISAARTYLTRA